MSKGEYPGKLLQLGDPGPPPEATGAGDVEVGIAVIRDKVVVKLNTATNLIIFDAQNAFDIGENLARAAHKARFPGESIPDRAYLAEQIRARVTDTIRAMLVGRAHAMLRSQREKRTVSNEKLARQLVDQLLSALT